jgi:hypothetical protein
MYNTPFLSQPNACQFVLEENASQETVPKNAETKRADVTERLIFYAKNMKEKPSSRPPIF